MYFLWQDLSHGTIIFESILTLWPWPWSLTYFWKTLTLAITFKPEVIQLLYCTSVFLVTRPLTWYHKFWPCDLNLELWPTFQKLLPWLLLSDGCRPASVVVFLTTLIIIHVTLHSNLQGSLCPVSGRQYVCLSGSHTFGMSHFTIKATAGDICFSSMKFLTPHRVSR